jgi:hypothetical protein
LYAGPMAKAHQPHPYSIAQSLLLDPLNAALELAKRVQEVDALRAYVLERRALIVVPVVLLILATSIGCAAGMVLFLGGTRPLLVLMAILLVPFVLIGSLFVQGYVFFAWLEIRALAKALHHRPASGSLPPVPWLLAVLFLLVPLAMLISVVPALGIALVVLHIAAPIAIARLDR